MKTLTVQDILGPLKGTLVRGSRTEPIRDAVEHPSQIRRRNTLVFDRYDKYLLPRAWRMFPRGVIVTDTPPMFLGNDCRWTIIYVKDMEQAFWDFVEYYRGLWDIPVIGVTGTCGKTTVKEMVSYILSESMRTQSTYKTYNGLVYNLRYLIGIDERTDAAVMEMKVAVPGDLLHTCRVFKPQIGIFTNIGTDHLEHCGTMENYIREKARLIDGLDPRGVLILNWDDANIRNLDTSSFQGKILTYGKGEGVDYRITQISYRNEGMRFTFSSNGRSYEASTHGYGEHTVYNAVAALIACEAVGVDLQTAIRRLASYRQLEAHLQTRVGINGCLLLDDTWSSNPTSAEAALKVLHELAQGKQTVAIMGRIGMLGEHTDEQHQMLGDKVVENQVDALITIDPTADLIGKRAIELGMDPRRVFSCHSPHQVYGRFRQLVDKDAVVLLKTSMMDRVDQIKKLIIKEGDRP
ncbi:hypothetical protein BEP19_09435 [Ammoniphilus oxalaticus]|uniref:UDP-N-acetylmuramoyl-tripeptide--D-alanyl-D-alanine ligase n=1 Tax=Ammoniphilus oxalaticus TaxID=66863 RepID=A0A419SKW1_9BACL|nr:UDP-N-acetylmuramoyl-tripeptide--D-alanyl-D-alanine ligase [Ammoniphilus oxalaticus]RKD24589.1 hypothetical protein BEP19_09435 [Ammoniphilus oxalaticus]